MGDIQTMVKNEVVIVKMLIGVWADKELADCYISIMKN